MSGHSKWSSIKHKKAATDAKRGKIFTKLIKEITVAARMGGGDLEANPRLRSAIAAAKGENMPKDNIERAIKKGTGELEGVNYEESIYEGYGPGGAAVLVESLTDNKNRTVADIRSIFGKNGGSLGENGCVAWMFDKKGYIAVESKSVDEEVLMEVTLDAGAEDIDTTDDEVFLIETAPGDLENIHKFLEEKSLEVKTASVDLVPQNKIEIDDINKAKQVIKFIEALEDDDDIQNVFSNFDISDSVLQELNN